MVSNLSGEIEPFLVMDVLERAKELELSGKIVIHFEVGEPDFPTPKVICDEAINAIQKGETKYTPSLGIPELRASVVESYLDNYGVDIPASRAVITMGSSPALFLALLALVDPGDEVLITDPYYACYPKIIRIAGAVPKLFRVYEQDGFQIDVPSLKRIITRKTKCIIINSPSNPTGIVFDEGIIREISELGPMVISDEIYHGLVYGSEAHSIYEFTDRAFVVNGMSKLYSMTGWRLGYLLAPDEFIRPIQKLQQNLFISPNPFVQRAGVAALRLAKDQVREMVQLFSRRREIMIDGLRALGFEIKAEPRGAFYVFVNESGLNRDSQSLAFDILEKAHVAVTPGIDFGPGGEGYLRFSYATSIDCIEEGLRRLDHYMRNGVGTR